MKFAKGPTAGFNPKTAAKPQMKPGLPGGFNSLSRSTQAAAQISAPPMPFKNPVDSANLAAAPGPQGAGYMQGAGIKQNSPASNLKAVGGTLPKSRNKVVGSKFYDNAQGRASQGAVHVYGAGQGGPATGGATQDGPASAAKGYGQGAPYLRTTGFPHAKLAGVNVSGRGSATSQVATRGPRATGGGSPQKPAFYASGKRPKKASAFFGE